MLMSCLIDATRCFLAEEVACFATVGTALFQADLAARIADHSIVDPIDTIGSGGVAITVDLTGGAPAEIVASLTRINLSVTVTRLSSAIANDVAIRSEGPPAIGTPLISIIGGPGAPENGRAT